MDWNQAIEAMKAGKTVRRVSESVQRLDGYTADGTPIYVTGGEPCNLTQAWTATGEPVLVVQGDWSRVLFDPAANALSNDDDWIVVPSDQKQRPDCPRHSAWLRECAAAALADQRKEQTR